MPFIQRQDTSAAEQIGNLLTGMQEEAVKRQQRKKEDVIEQVKLYGVLREQGYSPEDATSRVNRTFGSTGFLEKVLTGEKGNAFNPPATDVYEEKRRKERVDLMEKKAGIREKMAHAKYYEQGGSRSTPIDKWTPEQLQNRLRFLQNEDNPDFGTPENTAEIEDIQNRIRTSLGFEGAAKPKAQAKPGGAVSPEGTIITNPTTKQRLIKKGGQWVPYKG